MSDIIRAAREHNTRTLIHRKLANENILDVFLALADLDTPSLEHPQGWYLRVNGVCSLWREIALHSSELWARSAGSFPSRLMTDLVIQRARALPLSFDGHLEHHAGSGYVLTEDQFSLIETHVARLRSLVHEDYKDWSKLFYRLKTFPMLESARIWDDSGPDMWHACIDTPRLECLYLNNGLIPFNAPALRYLRVDMDNINWRLDREVLPTYDEDDDEPMTGSCETIPRVFPTLEFIAFLQRSPKLERLIVTDMPPLLSPKLPAVSELHADLPHLRGLHLCGKSRAMSDLWKRLVIPADTQIYMDTDYLDNEIDLKKELLDMAGDIMTSSVYDSLRLGMTPSYDLVLQLWSSETYNAPGLELSRSLELIEPTLGPAFTLRVLFAERELLEMFTDRPLDAVTMYLSVSNDPFEMFKHDVAKQFYSRAADFLHFLSPSFLKHVDLSDVPFVYVGRDSWGGDIKYDLCVTRLLSSLESSSPQRRDIVLNWALLSRVARQVPNTVSTRGRDYLPVSPFDLTLVDFPCAAFPSVKRYDEQINAEAWDLLSKLFVPYLPGHMRSGDLVTLRLAESMSELSNMERSEEPEYEHTISGTYEDAVRIVTEKGYQRIAQSVTSFEDLRVNTWQ